MYVYVRYVALRCARAYCVALRYVSSRALRFISNSIQLNSNGSKSESESNSHSRCSTPLGLTLARAIGYGRRSERARSLAHVYLRPCWYVADSSARNTNTQRL